MIKGPLIRFILQPKAFFIGVASGILACSLLGKYVSTKNYIDEFTRLGGGLQTRGVSFQITASAINSLIHKNCSTDKTLVLIGGSSVPYGSGQPVRYLWTKKLQNLLGSKYCVMNLASPAGSLVGYASIAFEMVRNDYPSAILVSDGSGFPSDPADGMIWYKYFFWDAYYKGLFKNPHGNYDSAQIDAIVKDNFVKNEKQNERFTQLRFGMWLDSYLYFNDLWTYLHYTKWMTIYDPSLRDFFGKPLRLINDYDYPVDVDKIKTLAHYPDKNSKAYLGELEIVRLGSSIYYTNRNGVWSLNTSQLDQGSKVIASHPLTKVSKNVLLMSIIESPYYFDQLSPNEQYRYHSTREEILKVWNKHGYNTVLIDNLKAEDFGDRPHVNTFGGIKLAKIIANEIKKIDTN